MHEVVFDYIRYNPFFMATARGAEPSFTPISDLRVWKTLMYITQELPLQLNYLFHKVRGDERKVLKAQKLKQMQKKMIEGYLGFDHFSINTWQYVSNYSERAWNVMSDSERVEFNIDVTSIDWAKAEQNFMYGIRRFFLKEDIMPPESKFQ